jgi:hypothetical protein
VFEGGGHFFLDGFDGDVSIQGDLVVRKSEVPFHEKDRALIIGEGGDDGREKIFQLLKDGGVFFRDEVGGDGGDAKYRTLVQGYNLRSPGGYYIAIHVLLEGVLFLGCNTRCPLFFQAVVICLEQGPFGVAGYAVEIFVDKREKRLFVHGIG